MKVCFICRGYPGLGKVVGAVAVDACLKRAYEEYESLFLTYYNGYAFLKQGNYSVVNLVEHESQISQSGFCTPFGLETRRCVDAIAQFQPDLVFNDGEPYLIEVTSEILERPTIVLAHPADLHSLMNSELAIRLFRYYYTKAALVIAHGLDRLPDDRTWLDGSAGQVVEINALVRDEIYQQVMVPTAIATTDPHVVGVLGGGSQNVSELFRAGTQQLGEWIIRACDEMRVEQVTLYCADQKIYHHLSAIAQKTTIQPTLIAHPQDNTQDLIRATLVIGRAGRNLMGELLALNKKAIVVPVGAEAFRGGNQTRTAERVVQLSPNIKMANLSEGYDSFRQMLERQLEAPLQPIDWQPGNREVVGALQPVIASLGLRS